MAVVGASPHPSFVALCYRNILRHGFPGPVYPVNRRAARIGEAVCYPSVRDLPEPVDLVLVGVPLQHVPAVLADCEARGVGAVDIISSGYAESVAPQLAGGVERQRQLRAFAQRTGIRLVGPNCLGLMSVPGRLMAIPTYLDRLLPGPVALVLQSGMMVPSVLITCQDRGMGFTYVVTSGNEADLDAADYFEYFVEDPNTRVLGGFIEEIRDVDKLLKVARRAADQRKPIVILKIGRSEAAQRAALAHTGSMVGSDRVVDALFRREGITRARSVDELVEMLAIFHTRKLPRGSGVAAVSVSGGVAGLLCDLAPDCGVTFPELLPATRQALRSVVPVYGNVGNPVDITGQGVFEVDLLRGALGHLAAAENIHVVLHVRSVPSKLDLQSPVGQALNAAVRDYPDTLFLNVSLVGGSMHEALSPDVPLVEPVGALDGIPFLQGAEPLLKAVAALVRYAEFQHQRATPAEDGPADLPADVAERARALVAAAAGRTLAEREGKALLALYGIAVPDGAAVADEESAVAAARRLGYPLALKVDAANLAHKSDVGGVVLGIEDEAALRSAFRTTLANVRAATPQTEVRGALVERLAPPGLELILGMTRDPRFGAGLLLGLGGIFAELLGETALRLLPVGAAEARAMLGELRGAERLLAGQARAAGAHAEPLDVEALLDVVARFSHLCQDLEGLVEAVDVNPLRLYGRGRGALALDCLVVRAL